MRYEITSVEFMSMLKAGSVHCCEKMLDWRGKPLDVTNFGAVMHQYGLLRIRQSIGVTEFKTGNWR